MFNKFHRIVNASTGIIKTLSNPAKYINTVKNVEKLAVPVFDERFINIHQKITKSERLYDGSKIQIGHPTIYKSPILDKRFQIDLVLPVLNQIPVMDVPSGKEIDCPTDPNREEKQAIRMIVIRRKKMNKHKLRKLRRRQKYSILKRIHRAEIRKEKHFQRLLMDQVRKAERFQPNRFVYGKLKQAIRRPLPNTWKGKRLPKFIIRQLLGITPKIDYKNIPQTQDSFT